MASPDFLQDHHKAEEGGGCEKRAFSHAPVLLAEVISALEPKATGRYVDATLGGAGHSAAIFEKLQGGGSLLSLDRDEEAILAAQAKRDEALHAKQMAQPGQDLPGWIIQQACFSTLTQQVEACWGSGTQVDGILADLGVSSPQLDQAERGFSYRQEAVLDMRMNQQAGETAAELILKLSEDELARIIRAYGEERYAGRCARVLKEKAIEASKEGRLLHTLEAAEAIAGVMPKNSRREKQHPARRSFQALRIAVNDELGELEALLDQALSCLKPGGRLALISFHSLEDRMIKHRLRSWSQMRYDDISGTSPLAKPIPAMGKLIGPRRGFVASVEEQTENFRAHSARLRVFEKATEAESSQRKEV